MQVCSLFLFRASFSVSTFNTTTLLTSCYRIRRVKCDEEKPRCHRCAGTGRQCGYDIARIDDDMLLSPFDSRLKIAVDISSVSTGVYVERRSFAYFHAKVAPVLSGAFDPTFWREVVLRVSRSEPAVWDSIIAISIIFEHSPITYPPGNFSEATRTVQNSYERYALKWYSRSISTVRQKVLLGKTSYHSIALLNCILFICFECLQCNAPAAIKLYKSGLAMMSNYYSRNQSGNNSFDATIQTVFFRFGVLVGLLRIFQ